MSLRHNQLHNIGHNALALGTTVLSLAAIDVGLRPPSAPAAERPYKVTPELIEQRTTEFERNMAAGRAGTFINRSVTYQFEVINPFPNPDEPPTTPKSITNQLWDGAVTRIDGTPIKEGQKISLDPDVYLLGHVKNTNNPKKPDFEFMKITPDVRLVKDKRASRKAQDRVIATKRKFGQNYRPLNAAGHPTSQKAIAWATRKGYPPRRGRIRQ